MRYLKALVPKVLSAGALRRPAAASAVVQDMASLVPAGVEAVIDRVSWFSLGVASVGGAAVVFSLLWRDRKEGSTAATEEKSVLQRPSATSFWEIVNPSKPALGLAAAIGTLSALRFATDQAEHAVTVLAMGGVVGALRLLDSIPGLKRGVVAPMKALANAPNGRMMVGLLLSRAAGAATAAWLVREVGADFVALLAVNCVAIMPIVVDFVWSPPARLRRIEAWVDLVVLPALPPFVETLAASRADVIAESFVTFDETWRGLGPDAIDASQAEMDALIERMASVELAHLIEPRINAALPVPLVAILGEAHVLQHLKSLAGGSAQQIDGLVVARSYIQEGVETLWEVAGLAAEERISRTVARESVCENVVGMMFDATIQQLRGAVSDDDTMRRKVHAVISQLQGLSGVISMELHTVPADGAAHGSV